MLEGKDAEIERLTSDLSNKQDQLSTSESTRHSDVLRLRRELQDKDNAVQLKIEQQYALKLNQARQTYQSQINELQAKNTFLAETAEQLASENQYWKEQSFATTFADEINGTDPNATNLNTIDSMDPNNTTDLYGTLETSNNYNYNFEYTWNK